MSDYRDIPCPSRYWGDEDVLECNGVINHPGDHQYVFTWPEEPQVHGPSIPHALHVALGRCTPTCAMMQVYAEKIGEHLFAEKPMLWELVTDA